jgi:hypothetical protein
MLCIVLLLSFFIPIVLVFMLILDLRVFINSCFFERTAQFFVHSLYVLQHSCDSRFSSKSNYIITFDNNVQACLPSKDGQSS